MSISLLKVVSGNNKPGLIDPSMEFPLTDISVRIRLSSLDIQSFSIRKSVDVTSFSCPISFSHWSNVEEATFKLSGVRTHNSSISFVFLLNMKSSIASWMNKGVSLIVLVYVEDLAG